MLKIVKPNAGNASLKTRTILEKVEFLYRYCISEKWSIDPATGVLRLGRLASMLHGLENSTCGLLTLVRCYDEKDRGGVLTFFEECSAGSAQPSYSATIMSTAKRNFVFCIGKGNSGGRDKQPDVSGIFFFPALGFHGGQNGVAH